MGREVGKVDSQRRLPALDIMLGVRSGKVIVRISISEQLIPTEKPFYELW